MPTPDTRVDIFPERVSLSFVLTGDDVAAYYRAYATTDPTYVRTSASNRANYRASVALGAMMAVGVTIIVLIALGGTSASHRVLITSLGGTGIAMWCYFMAKGYRTALATMHATETMTAETLRPELQYQVGPVSVDMTASGLVWRMRHHDTTQRWTGVADVRHTPASVHIVRLDQWGYLIPRRIFASEEQVVEVLRLCRGWLDALGHSDASRAREWLAGHNVQCPQCNYNLRGGTGRSCPECGLEFSPEFLSAIAARNSQSS